MEQRSRRWWVWLVYVVIALNVAGVLLIGLRGGLDLTGVIIFLAGALLGIFGLRLRSSNAPLGSWMIVAACVPPMLPFWIVIPAAISVVTIITGLVSKELQLVPAKA